MASPNVVFTEMVTTTLRNHPSMLSDVVSNHNALWRRMNLKGNIKLLDGGYQIVEPLDFQDNSTFQRYSGFDTLNIGASDVLTAAQYEWVQAAVNVVSSGRELRMNSGKEQIINLAEARVKNAMRTAANYMSVDLYSDGGLPNQMGGLALLIQTNGQGTVGGINSANYANWQNQYLEASGTNAVTKSNIKGYMEQLYLSCVRGTDQPDLITSTNDWFALYWESLSDNQRYITEGSASAAVAGFRSLKFNTADVIHDINTNFASTGEKMYFLNTDYIYLKVHRDANWVTLDEKTSVNQDAVVIPVIWQGQLTTSNRRLQGVFLDAA